MNKQALFAVALIFMAAYLSYARVQPRPTPIQSADSAQNKEIHPSRLYRDQTGREVRISTPLLDRFPHVDDHQACEELKSKQQRQSLSSSVFEICSSLSVGTSANIGKKQTRLATIIAFGEAYKGADEELDDEEEAAAYLLGETLDWNSQVALALSLYKTELDLVPPDAPAQAFEILKLVMAVGYANDPLDLYDPAFLFKAAMESEVGEAALTLCPLVDSTDCNKYITKDLTDALQELGRWKADEAMLLRCTALLEHQYNHIKDPSRGDQLDFALDYSNTLGFANEIDWSKGTSHVRRGVKPLEEWLERHKGTATRYELDNAYTSLGAAYGRIAEQTKLKSDAEKAEGFDRASYELDLQFGIKDWHTISNLGDSVLLLGEVERQGDKLQQALELHRDAYAIVRTSKEPYYMQMKLSRTLLHYASANFLALGDSERMALLEESIGLAQEIIPLFEKLRSDVYLRMTRNILEVSTKKLQDLRSKMENAQ